MTNHWLKAPHWAKFHAKDADGSSFWFEHRPRASHGEWDDSSARNSGGRIAPSTYIPSGNWEQSLESRP